MFNKLLLTKVKDLYSLYRLQKKPEISIQLNESQQAKAS